MYGRPPLALALLTAVASAGAFAQDAARTGPMQRVSLPGIEIRPGSFSRSNQPSSIARPSDSSVRDEGSQETIFVGVMGQVVRPGVYASRESTLHLPELIHQAGGLASDASGRIRIIRNGNVAYADALAARPAPPLLPGDLVIVDSIPNAPSSALASTSASIPSWERSSLGRRESPTGQQVAVVGLIDRPVVLKVQRTAATIETLVTSLGQSPDVVPTVKTLLPSTTAGTAPTVDPWQLLPNTSVLIFDPAVVDADRIPPLPGPIGLARVASASFAPVSGDVQQIAGVSAASDLDGDPPGEARVTSAFSTIELPPPPDMLEIPDEWSDDPAVVYGEAGVDSNTRDAADESAEGVAAVSPTALEPNSVAAAQNEATLSDESAAVSADDEASNPITKAIILVGLLGVVTACGVLWSMVRMASEARTVRPDHPAGGARHRTTVLDALIQNELPLDQESVELPLQLQLYGRPLGPQQLRFDPAQAVQGPHMLRETPIKPSSGSPVAVDAAVSAPADSTDQSPIKQLRTDAGHDAAAAMRPASARPGRVLDRALSNVPGVERP